MRALCRVKDWSATPVGPVDSWPVSLRTTLVTMFASRQPMLLFWGPELTQFYNDDFRPSLGSGDRHPRGLGMNAREFWADAWPIVGDSIASVLATGVAVWFEDAKVPIERNGQMEDVWWTYSYGPAFDDDLHVNGVLVVVQETTSRVVAERRMRELNEQLATNQARLASLLDASPSCMAVFSGPHHVITYVNPTWERVVGKKEVIGRSVREVFPEMIPSGVWEELDRIYESGESYRVDELELPLQRTPDGPLERTFWNFSWAPLPGAYPVGTTGLGGDIVLHAIEVTAQVLARQEIDAALAEAELANRAKSEFLAVMSHELRTPLNAIGGYADLLAMGLYGQVTPSQREAIDRMQRSQHHLLGLVNGVLNYARVEAGSLDFMMEDVAIAPLVEGCETLIEPQALEKQLDVRVHTTDASLTARADAEKLQQVMLNLLSNAVKFTEHGGTIEITCERSGDCARVRVRDTGIGIASRQLDRIFEPFVQVDARLTRTSGGAGLGLAISRELARGMGGDLTVESEEHVGSVFTLELPLGSASERPA